jgi:hypothetical protein
MRILFFKTETTDACSIHRLYNGLEKKLEKISLLKRRHQKHLVNDYYESFSRFLSAKGHKKIDLEKLIVFGSRDKEYPVLKSAQRNKFINHSWFDCNTSSSISVFFVKGGASLLLEDHWPYVFKRWVAFEKFDFLNTLPEYKKEYNLFYRKLFIAINKCESSEKIKDEIISSYDEFMERLANKYPENDNLVMIAYMISINRLNIFYQD